ncbi:hypothetical protein, partial [Mycobacterium tuberculosis]|uniref:hypothetical protein n=1 Tax=Mycobacterium tuberculosis TaxID=1773 RepID=UPI001BE06351
MNQQTTINGALYAAEGDMVNAGLSLAGIIPFLGWGATGGKFGMKASDDVGQMFWEGGAKGSRISGEWVDINRGMSKSVRD